MRQYSDARGVQPLAAVLAAVLVIGAALAGVPYAKAADQAVSLYYQEIAKDGRVYVFNTPERYKAFKESGEVGQNITLVGRGPNGETIVAENETALDLYLFKHNLPGYDRPTQPGAPPPVATYPQVKLGGLAYISYQDGTAGGMDYSRTTVKRAYVDTQAKILPYLSARATFDINQDSTGDWKARFKYVYGKLDLGSTGFLAKNYVEFGLDHMPWLDFEEHINLYRLQDPMFMERNGLFNSADVGLLVGGNFGSDIPADYKKTVSGAYPGRWGSYQIGVYNGTGYHASEANTNKVLEGRITIRPMPDIVPGLQFSYFGISGKGNTAAAPDWTLNAGMVSYQGRYAVVTGQYFTGKGNQAGTAVDAYGQSLRRDGWSVFVEGKFSPTWSAIVRYDEFNPNTDAGQQTNKRTIVGVAYHFNGNNMILLDYDRLEYEQPGKPTDKRAQLTLQVAF